MARPLWFPFLLFLLLPMQVFATDSAGLSGKPAHHTADGFRNYPPFEPTGANLGFEFYWKRFKSSFNLPDVPPNHFLPTESALARYREHENENSVTWIGQSTLLIKLDGKTILTDPFFKKHAAPFDFGPQRYVDPGIPQNQLPPIDIIIVSHNHYGHLDADFIAGLPNRESVAVYVPLRLGSFFTERGYKNVHELDWYESKTVGGIQVTALPCVHYSSRGIGDKNKTLWCAWALTHTSKNYFFLGDSAYSPVIFKNIGETFEGFDLAFVTIGTYGNRKYGVNNHTNPEEAVAIGKEIKARALMGIHWGTIDLSEEDPWEPPERFKAAARKAGYTPDDIWLFKIGETRKCPSFK